MDATRDPKAVVRDFPWQGDLAHTGARQGRFFAAFEFVAEGDLVVHRSTRRVRGQPHRALTAPTAEDGGTA